jgi:hypothetical protein
MVLQWIMHENGWAMCCINPGCAKQKQHSAAIWTQCFPNKRLKA